MSSSKDNSKKELRVKMLCLLFQNLRAGGIVTRKDVSVKELRHVIPLLIMDIYGFKDEPAQKKGMLSHVKLLKCYSRQLMHSGSGWGM